MYATCHSLVHNIILCRPLYNSKWITISRNRAFPILLTLQTEWKMKHKLLMKQYLLFFYFFYFLADVYKPHRLQAGLGIKWTFILGIGQKETNIRNIRKVKGVEQNYTCSFFYPKLKFCVLMYLKQ